MFLPWDEIVAANSPTVPTTQRYAQARKKPTSRFCRVVLKFQLLDEKVIFAYEQSL